MISIAEQIANPRPTVARLNEFVEQVLKSLPGDKGLQVGIEYPPELAGACQLLQLIEYSKANGSGGWLSIIVASDPLQIVHEYIEEYIARINKEA